MIWHECIHSNPSVLAGKPVVRGTRLSVEFLLGLLSEGWTGQQILDNHPQLSDEARRALLAFAAECSCDEFVPPVSQRAMDKREHTQSLWRSKFMKSVLSIFVATGVALFCYAPPAIAQDQACDTIPASATEVETAILNNQCKILKELSTIKKGVISESISAGSNGYVIFTPGAGITGGNPCSEHGMQAQSCGTYLEDLMERACWDGRCGPILAPRVTDAMPKWKSYLLDPSATSLDWSKLSEYIRKTPGAMTLYGDVIIFNADSFLNLTDPSEFVQ